MRSKLNLYSKFRALEVVGAVLQRTKLIMKKPLKTLSKTRKDQDLEQKQEGVCSSQRGE